MVNTICEVLGEAFVVVECARHWYAIVVVLEVRGVPSRPERRARRTAHRCVGIVLPELDAAALELANVWQRDHIVAVARRPRPSVRALDDEEYNVWLVSARWRWRHGRLGSCRDARRAPVVSGVGRTDSREEIAVESAGHTRVVVAHARGILRAQRAAIATICRDAVNALYFVLRVAKACVLRVGAATKSGSLERGVVRCVVAERERLVAVRSVGAGGDRGEYKITAGDDKRCSMTDFYINKPGLLWSQHRLVIAQW